MKTLTTKEWGFLYKRFWRQPFENWSKESRARLVRACMGKAIYDSYEEALKVIAGMPIRPGFYLKAYECQLCFRYVEVDGVRVLRRGIHIGNSRIANQLPSPSVTQLKSHTE